MRDGDRERRERRIEHLIERLPASARPAAHWLRSPAARPVRIPVGGLLCVGGVLGMLPVLGFWMLPAGLVLLAEDVPPLTRASDRMLDWIERRKPDWFAAAPGASPIAATLEGQESSGCAARRHASHS